MALGKARPWTPKWWVMQGWDSSVCPGYSCSLPEVVEVTHAYAQWEAGTLTEWLDGEPPTKELLDALAARKYGLNDKAQADLPEPR